MRDRNCVAARSPCVALVASLLLAVCGGGCLSIQSLPAGEIDVRPQFNNPGPRPEAWLVELIARESNIQGPFFEGPNQQPIQWHISFYELHELSPERSTLRVPAMTLFWGLAICPFTGFSQMTEPRSWCYVHGYERAFQCEVDGKSDDSAATNSSTSKPGDAPAGVRLVGHRMVPWDISTKEFKSFWADLSDEQKFADRVSQWKRLVERGDPAVRRLLEWYIARYAAAVASDPRLANERTAAEHIATVGELLELARKRADAE